MFVGVMIGVAIPLRAPGVAIEQGALGLALIGALVLVCKIPNIRHRIRVIFLSPAGLALAAMFAFWAVGLFFSYNPWGSLRIGGRTVALLGGSVVLWATLKEFQDTHEMMLKVLVLSALGIALAVLMALNGGISMVARPVMAYKPFAVSAMCLIPVVVWAGRKLDGVWRVLGYVYAPLALVIIIQTFNRSALAGGLGMAMTVVTVLVMHKHRYTKALLGTLSALALGVLIFIFTKEHSTVAFKGLYLPEWLVDPHRQYIWQFAFNSFLDHPWFGDGIDQSNYIPGSEGFAPGFDGKTSIIPSHPHNALLEILAETGLLGFLPFLFALGGIVWRLFKRCLAVADEGDLALLTVMAGFWSSALFNFSIWATWWQLTLFMLVAIIASARHRPDSA